jgi:hypothetical protein
MTNVINLKTEQAVEHTKLMVCLPQLTNKLMTSIGNPHGGLDCSLPGSLVHELPSSVEKNDKLLKQAPLRTFRKQLTRRQGRNNTSYDDARRLQDVTNPGMTPRTNPLTGATMVNHPIRNCLTEVAFRFPSTQTIYSHPTK